MRLIDSARVTFGSGDRTLSASAIAIFGGHLDETAHASAIVFPVPDTDHDHERRKPYDRLMRQTPRPR